MPLEILPIENTVLVHDVTGSRVFIRKSDKNVELKNCRARIYLAREIDGVNNQLN
jgi:hypothetical protein